MLGFEEVVDDPSLPRVLLLGDSISIGYTPAVRRELAGRANVHRVPDNARSTRESLGKLDEMIVPGPWRVIHFNCGAHDITRMKEGVVDPEGTVQVPIDEYENNLRVLIKRLSETGAQLVWARTTSIKPYNIRFLEDICAFNVVADRVMAEAGIPVNDLFTSAQWHLDTLKDKVHFNDEGSAILGAQVAQSIARYL
jgi:acyl-CoA thioesterase-1